MSSILALKNTEHVYCWVIIREPQSILKKLFVLSQLKLENSKYLLITALKIQYFDFFAFNLHGRIHFALD